MRYLFARQIVVALLLATTVWAAKPLAVITSAESFELSGVTIPVTGVPSWPLVEGDEVVTKGSGAILMFDKHTKVVLDKDSAVKLKRRQNGKTTLQLLKGALRYSLSPSALLQILALDREVDVSSSRGSVSVADENVLVAPLASDGDPELGITVFGNHLPPGPPAQTPADCSNPNPGSRRGRSPCSPGN